MKYNFNNNQLEFIKKLTNIDANGEINEKQEKEIMSAIKKEFFRSFDKNDMPTEITILCDSIADIIHFTKLNYEQKRN